MSAIGFGAISLFAFAACAPGSHTVDPYDRDPAAASALEERALSACGAMGADESVERTAFVTDGCSVWPDSGWVGCCVEHDIPYWCGGTERQRLDADQKLRSCVSAVSSPAAGAAMYWGVRVGGHPIWPTYWRWGYGRAWPEGYCDED